MAREAGHGLLGLERAGSHSEYIPTGAMLTEDSEVFDVTIHLRLQSFRRLLTALVVVSLSKYASTREGEHMNHSL